MSAEVKDVQVDSDYREVDESSFDLTPEDSVAKLIAKDRVHSPDAMPSPKALELLSIWQAEEDGADDPFDWRAEYDRQLAEDLHPAFDSDATQWNSGELSGAPCDEWRALMHRDAAFTYGNVKSKDKRNDTRDDAWAPKSMPVFNAIEGNAAKRRLGGKVVRAEWGLSRHVEDDHKGGAGSVLGACQGHRKAKAVTTIDAIGLDCDTGHLTYEEAVSRARALDFAFAAYTSFNHLTTESEFNYDAVVKHARCDGKPSLEQTKNFARDKKKLAPHIIDSFEIEAMREHKGAEGLFIRVRHLPIEKYRLIFFLRSTVTIADLGNTLAEAHDVHSQKVMGLAEMVGVPTDPATLDVSRFFYAARHREGAEHHVAIHRAPPIDYHDIPTVEKTKQSAGGHKRRPDVVVQTPDGVTVDVSALFDRYAKRWELATITEYCDLQTSVAANNSGGKFHVACPYADGHTDSADDTATFAMNAEDSETEFAVLKCLHGSCQGRHLVDYLGAWIESGDLDPALLEDPDFMLDFADDQEEDKFFRLTPDEKAALADEAAQAGADITADSNDDDLKAHFKALIKIGDQSEVAREVVRVASDVKHPLGKSGPNRLVKDVRTEMAADARQRASNDLSDLPDIGTSDDPAMVEYVEERLLASRDDEGNPVVYQYKGDVAVVRDGQRLMLTTDQFAAVSNDHAEFKQTKSAGDNVAERKVFATDKVIKHAFYRMPKPYPELSQVMRSPYFLADGTLVMEHGYNASAETFLDLGGLEIPAVPAHPTECDVFKAKRLFAEPLADFPFDGVTDRKERMRRALFNCGGSASMPSVAHAVTKTLERFVRPMIDGPTPACGIAKNHPGTGGSLLAEVVTIIATGDEAPMEDIPTTDEEFTKVKSAMVNEGPDFCIFDNPNEAIDSGPFASLLTAANVKARLLGSSRYVEAPVLHTTAVIANHLKGTKEILRRLVMIELNARSAEPETRTGWRHKFVKDWVRQHRGELVWACLVLVQNWIAKGMKPWKGEAKGSYEKWSAVMGGILRDAGIRGFLENEERLRSYASTEQDLGLQQFIDHLANLDDGTLLRPGGTSEIRGRKGERVVSIQDELNLADEGKPLALSGFGYNSEDHQYNHARQIKENFRELARGTYKTVVAERDPQDHRKTIDVEYEISFEENPDPKSQGTFYWVFNKKRMGMPA